jgi:mixed-linked glucan synthase
MAPGVGDGRRNNGEVVPADGNGGRCACGSFQVCACGRGAAAVASADMDAVVATEGQIGAVNDESWVAVDQSDDLSAADDAGVAIEDRPVFRTEKIKGVLLHPYRYTAIPSLVFPHRLLSPQRSCIACKLPLQFKRSEQIE